MGKPVFFRPEDIAKELAPVMRPLDPEGFKELDSRAPIVTFSDLKIRTKTKELITFVPNETQALYGDMMTERYLDFDWRNNKYELRGFREDDLKARQQGLSTWWLALFFLDTINVPRTQTIILTDNGERSETLFRIIHRFYENLPEEKKRPKKYSTKREIEFSDIDSIIAVGTAGTSNVGRGGTVSNALLSERAFWINGDDIEAGLLESVPMEVGNVVRETTANGFNEYYVERQRCHSGESRFTPRFFGWNLHSEYRIAVPAGFKRTEEEEKLVEAHNLDDGQLAWRREKIKDLKDKFPQEYPLTEMEAFVSSGNPYFDRTILIELQRELQDPDYLPIQNIRFSKVIYPRLREVYRDKQLLIYRTPIESKDTEPNLGATGRLAEISDVAHTYIVTADPSEGIVDGKHDYSAVQVLDAITWEQCAVIHGLFTPTLLAHIVNELAWYYNMALIGVLRNNHGHEMLSVLQHYTEQPDGTLGYPVQRSGGNTGIYCYDPSEVRGTRAPLDSKRREPGYPESETSKIIMLDSLQSAIEEEPGMVIYDKGTVSELLSFVKLPNGGAGAESGCHDDRVSALGLGALLLDLRFKRKKKSRDREPVSTATSSSRRTGR